MKRFAILLMVSVLLAGGCTSQQVLDNAQMANALIDMRIQYDSARQALDAVIDQLPTETGLQLLELEQDADSFVAAVTASWKLNPDLSPAYIDRIYTQGKAIYQRGYDIIYPQLDALPPGAVTALVRLQAKAEAIDEMYQRVKNADADTRQMVTAGLELATLALKIGVLAM